jgi:hypothetical protein
VAAYVRFRQSARAIRPRTVLVLGALALALMLPAAASAVRPGGNANGEIQMLNPHQKIKFNVQQGNVEYWNFDFPEGAGTLHYQTTISCSFIDAATKEARIMFQIPAGHPGLSGLYVVSYVKIVDAATKSYLYGHAGTADLATATAWCQTGSGFSPSMYKVKSGVLYVKGDAPPAAA